MKQHNKDDILDIGAYMYRVIRKFKWDILIALDMLQSDSKSSFEEDLALPF
jgi:hypothetical protein